MTSSYDAAKDIVRTVLGAAPLPLLLLGLVGLAIVVLPDSVQCYLGYKDMIAPYRGPVSLGSILFLVSGAGGLAKPGIKKLYKDWRTIRKNRKGLLALASNEKRILARYIKEDVSTLTYDSRDGTMGSLKSKGIVYTTDPFTAVDFYEETPTAWAIQPWVAVVVEKYPDVKNAILAADEDAIEDQDTFGD